MALVLDIESICLYFHFRRLHPFRIICATTIFTTRRTMETLNPFKRKA